jgi:hypothetical protein
VIVPRCHHLDAGGLAAGVQNNGRPEEVSTTLTHFILTGIPGQPDFPRLRGVVP